MMSNQVTPLPTPLSLRPRNASAAASDSAVGQAYANWQHAVSRLDTGPWPPDRLERELRRHQAVVDGATPDADFAAIAAAEAAVQVLTRHLEPARQLAGRRAEDEAWARDRSNEAWDRYFRLRDIADRWPASGLTGPDRDSLNHLVRRDATPADLEVELIRMVGVVT